MTLSNLLHARSLRRVLTIVLFALSCASFSKADPNYTFTQIDFPGSTSTSANGINNAGQIVGDFNGGSHGFILSGSSFTQIDFPGYSQTSLYGINDTGQIVGIFKCGNICAFLKSGSSFTQINPPRSLTTSANGINDAGQIVGSFGVHSAIIAVLAFHGFLLSGSSLTEIDFPGAGRPGVDDTIASGINHTGQIAGWFRDAAGRAHGFLLSSSSFTQIDFPDLATQAFGINDAGQIVGQAGSHGFLLSGSSFSQIDFPGATSTSVNGINNAGQLVGVFADATGRHGFIATPTSDVFASFAPWAIIDLRDHAFAAGGNFTLGDTGDVISPLTESVRLQVGTFSTTRPPGSFKPNGFGGFQFHGTVNGVNLLILIQPRGGKKYSFSALGWNADLSGTANPVTVSFAVGDDSGTATITAAIIAAK